ncbi:hypothetical protein [Endozoicomonas sp.]|uniref:hypothetical protein n=1 Tax=Endozoicomonas sp. TaxID=1892382 RepID=UPI00383B4F62
MAFFIFLPGTLLAAVDDGVKFKEILLNYQGKEILNTTISVECSSHDNVCQSVLEFEKGEVYQNNGSQFPLRGLRFKGYFHRNPNNMSELGSIIAHKDDKETTIPLSIDYQELPLGNKDNPLTRAIIAQLHPALIERSYKEINNTTDISDYLTGETKNSETLHLFKPEPHHLSSKDISNLKHSINDEFLILDIGDSYSMVLIFDHDNYPSSVYVLDRWKLYRSPVFKTVIGYGDLVGLVLHGMDFIKHGGSLLGVGDHASHGSHFASLERLAHSIGIGHQGLHRLTSLIGAGFHIAEIIDHTNGVGEFINGGQKHYHDHHHGAWGEIFGVLHLGHTFFELATDRSLAHGIQMVLTVASFGYHHVPHHYYEYTLPEVIRPVVKGENKRHLNAKSIN